MTAAPKRLDYPAAPNVERNQDCCGALLRISEDELQGLRSSGVVFDTVFKDGNGFFDARARCSDRVEVRKIPNRRFRPEDPQTFRTVVMGLCSRCSSLEDYARRTRSESKGKAR